MKGQPGRAGSDHQRGNLRSAVRKYFSQKGAQLRWCSAMADESREGNEWISLSSPCRMATGHHSGLRDMQLHGFKRQLHTRVLFFPPPWGKPWKAHGEVQREPSQILPTFCNRREPEYLVTMEYSSPPKASAQDFTLKKGAKRRKINVNNSWLLL